MSSQAITRYPVAESPPSEIFKSLPRPNFAAWFVLSVVVFIWYELTPIWLSPVSWLIVSLAPIFWFLCNVFLALAGVLICTFAMVVFVLLLSGAVPSSKGF